MELKSRMSGQREVNIACYPFVAYFEMLCICQEWINRDDSYDDWIAWLPLYIRLGMVSNTLFFVNSIV